MADLSGVENITRTFKSTLEKKGLTGLQSELDESLKCWKNTKIDIAVTGASGAGKSTFINSVLGLAGNHAAPTGITETTMDVKSYTSKLYSNVVFWDLPGVGTPTFPRDKYVHEVKLETFDFFILLTQTSFSENDVWLANQIQQLGKGYFLVRSHVGQDIRNYKKAHPKCTDPNKQLSVIRHNCEKTLKEDTENLTVIPHNFEQIRVYLIDSFILTDFDFNTLVDDLIKLAGGAKANVLVSALSSATQEIIDKKFHGLLHRILCVSMQAGLNCTVYNPEHVIKDVFAQESKFYREVFEIDDKTLGSVPELLNLSRLGVDIMGTTLERISQNLIQSHIERFQKCIHILKKKNNPNFDDLNISSKSYVKMIYDILLLYMKCMHLLASNLFQNVPKQVVNKHL
jgi:predicted GTPase